MDRIRVIERSLVCFVCGWLSFIPLAGIIPAIRAVRLYRQVRAEVGQNWNPADRYLFFGYVLAWVGSLITVIPLGLALSLLLKQAGGF